MTGKRINKIHYASHYLKSYKRLPSRIYELQDKKEQWFQKNPFNPRLETHKLKGKHKEFYSYSVTRSCRVLFRFIKKDEVIFYDIGAHEIYK